MSYGGASLPIGKEFIEIGSKFEKNRPISDEGNAFDEASVNVFFVSIHFTSISESYVDLLPAYAKVYPFSHIQYFLNLRVSFRWMSKDGKRSDVPVRPLP